MTFLLPEAAIAALEAAGIGPSAAATAAIAGTALRADLNPLDSLKTVGEIVDKIGSDINDALNQPLTPQIELLINIKAAVAQALQLGEITPGEVNAAVEWVYSTEHLGSISGAYVAEGKLAAMFTLWAINHAHPVAATTSSATKSTAPAIVITPTSEATSSPGANLVAEAQRLATSYKITVPGLTSAQTKALGAAIGDSYGNALKTMIGVANGLLAGISSVGDLAQTAEGTANEAYKTAGVIQPAVSKSLATIEDDITNLDGSIKTLEGQIGSTDSTVTQMAAELTNLQDQIATLETTIPQVTPAPVAPPVPTQTTFPDLTSLEDTVAQQGAEIATLEAVLASIGAYTATMTLADLANCCAFNDSVTEPIANSVSPLSNLAGLGSLLLDAAVLGVAASWVTAILAIFDTDDTLLATARAAELVGGWIDTITPQFIGDSTWADQLAGVSG